MNNRIKNFVFLTLVILSPTYLIKAGPEITLTGKKLIAWNVLMGNIKGDLIKLGIELTDIQAVVNIKDEATGNTPLHMAGDKGNQTLYDKLLSWGADPMIENNERATAQDLFDLALNEKEHTGKVTPTQKKASAPKQHKTFAQHQSKGDELFRSRSELFKLAIVADIQNNRAPLDTNPQATGVFDALMYMANGAYKWFFPQHNATQASSLQAHTFTTTSGPTPSTSTELPAQLLSELDKQDQETPAHQSPLPSAHTKRARDEDKENLPGAKRQRNDPEAD